ncbi:MAG: PIN domain-containing protein [Cyanobacteria bacterium]|nr:PIN domain-containing protein [Cyanobacteriota bacterium]
MSSIVIDTHTLIWYLTQSPKISTLAIDRINQANQNNLPVLIASITLIELIYLSEKQRIPAFPLQQFFTELDTPNSPFSIISLTLDIAQSLRQIRRGEVPELPDRIITATAHAINLPLITCDHKIRACTVIQTIWD